MQTKKFTMTAKGASETGFLFEMTPQGCEKGNAVDDCRLLESAPELLAALEVVLAFSGNDMPAGWDHIVGFCEKAIAKAKGGEA